MRNSVLSLLLTFVLAGPCCADEAITSSLHLPLVLSPSSQQALAADPLLARLWSAAELHSEKLHQMLKAEHLAKSAGLSYSPPGEIGTSYPSLAMSLTDPTEPEYRAIPSVASDRNFGARFAASGLSIVGSAKDPASLESAQPQTAADIALEEILSALRECRQSPQIVLDLKRKLSQLPPHLVADREWIEHQISYSMRQWRAAYENLLSFCGAEALAFDKMVSPVIEEVPPHHSGGVK